MHRLISNCKYKKEPFSISNFDDGIFLSLKEISLVFRDRYLLEKESFFVIDKDTGAIDSSIYMSDYKLEAGALKKAINNKNTVLIKNLENLNQKIKKVCDFFSSSTSVHMYVTPDGGCSFPMHKDDRHIFIRMLYGSKIIICVENNNEVPYMLNSGDWMHIPFGIDHRAVNCGPSISISFGIIESESKYVNLGIEEIDLKNMLGV